MKGLVFAYFFPPLNSSEGNVTFKLLSASKYSHDVFYQNKLKIWSYGKNNSLKNSRIHLIPSNNESLKNFKIEGITLFSNRKLDEYDFMMSRSMPLENHEIALALKKKNPDKFWLASFGDPIANNPYEKYVYEFEPKPFLFSSGGLKCRIRKIIYRKRNKNYTSIQNEIFTKADKIIFNNEFQCRYMLGNQYNKYISKSLILPHSYDTALYGEKMESKDNRIKILFTGHTDNIRSLRIFLEAIESKKDYFKDKIKLTIFGNLPQNDRDYIKEKNLSSIIIYGQQVGYKKSLNEMKNSDLLIHVDAFFSKEILKENIFFAAKIADYLGSGTKILGLTSDGISKNILQNNNQYCLKNNKDLIKRFLINLTEGKIDLNKSSHLPFKYDVVNVAKQYDNILSKIVKE